MVGGVLRCLFLHHRFLRHLFHLLHLFEQFLSLTSGLKVQFFLFLVKLEKHIPIVVIYRQTVNLSAEHSQSVAQSRRGSRRHGRRCIVIQESHSMVIGVHLFLMHLKRVHGILQFHFLLSPLCSAEKPDQDDQQRACGHPG